MPPRKRAAAPVPKIPHTDSCDAPSRVESFPAVDQDGAELTVTRCIGCGAQLITQ